MKDKTLKILLTGSGAPGCVTIYKCLTRRNINIEIYGCDTKKQTAGSFYAKKHFTVPDGSDTNYISKILNLCEKEKIDILLPITDSELLPLSKNKVMFKKHGINIAISDSKAILLTSNKASLFEFLKLNKLNSPKFFVVKNWNEFEKALKDLGFPDK